MEWCRLDIETVCCSDRDIFLAASDRLLQFRELRLRKVFRLPEGDRVRNFYAGRRVLLATLNQGYSYLVVDRESMTLKAARIRFRVPLESGNLHVVSQFCYCR